MSRAVGIVTNLHVIQGSLSVEVKLSNGDVYDDVTVSAVDQRRDLALIRIRAARGARARAEGARRDHHH